MLLLQQQLAFFRLSQRRSATLLEVYSIICSLAHLTTFMIARPAFSGRTGRCLHSIFCSCTLSRLRRAIIYLHAAKPDHRGYP